MSKNLIRIDCGVAVLLCLSLGLCTGCRSIGPATVKRDRLHYSAAVADSWKEQLLLNLVKTRYGDPPVFLEVSSLVSGYSLETGVSFNGQFSPENLRGDTFVGGELSGRFTDRPTISYVPMMGEEFARSLMAPVPLDAVWAVIQGGIPVDFLLNLTLQMLEGHRNMGVSAGEFRPEDPAFARAIQLLALLQRANAFDPEIQQQGGGVELWCRFERTEAPGRDVVEALLELKRILGVPTDVDRVRVVFGQRAPEPAVIGMRTRSLMQILSTLGAGVDVPAEHRAEGGVVVVEPSATLGGFTVKSGKERPEEAFVAVPYQGYWFWIERQDLVSKTTLGAVTVMFNFLKAGGAKVSPVLTIPAG